MVVTGGHVYLPEFNIILERGQKSWIEDNFLECLEVLVSPVKPGQTVFRVVGDRFMCTATVNPLVLITNMV